ncbi:MAG TPA: hypothetical protein VFI47_18675 [Acidimicrobiales bacterium]|nr:hypothetical protein [Acidimicrobiales bacterium]
MGKASSSKKVARAARAGGRSSSNRQRNLLFPGVILGIVVLGGALVAYAANDRKTDTAVPPVVNVDHWHAALGIDICGESQPVLPEFESRIGIHTHGDGVIHIHPFSSGGAGDNATLGAFLDGAGVTLTGSELKIGDETWKEGDQQCDGKDAELVVAQWNDVQDTEEKPALVRRDFSNIRFTEDGMGFTIAFVPEGETDIPMPDSAANLAELGAADTSAGETTTSAPPAGDTTAPVDPTATTAPADPTATTAPAG